MPEPMPLMYERLAPWFHLLSPPADDDDEAREMLALMEAGADAPVVDVLELGSGGGSDEPSGRGVRFLEWDRPIAADGVTVITD